MSENEVITKNVRETAQQLLDRIKSDQEFRRQVEEDPISTLTAAGLPESTVGTFLKEADMADVEGYCLVTTICGQTCVGVTTVEDIGP